MEKKEGGLYSYEVKREGGENVLYVNYLGAPFVPDIAEHNAVMERAVSVLADNQNVSRIVLVQQKNYNYDSRETFFLLEIAQLYIHLTRQESILSKEKISPRNPNLFTRRYNNLFSFLALLKQDPFSAYFDLKKNLMQEKIFLDKIDAPQRLDQENYIRLLERILEMFENLGIFKEARPNLMDYRKGERDIYHKIFKPDVIPNFTFTRLVSDLPQDAEIVDQYKISNNEYDSSLVTILRNKDESKLIYHLVPPENTLSEDYHMILNYARKVLIEHQPKSEEFTDTERTRQVFFNIAKDLLQDLAQTRGIKMSYSDVNKLATILVRHTIGFGVLEVLLQDKKLQDISLNAPVSMIPIFVRHQDYDECLSNIIPSSEDTDSWAAKFRLISGRPLDEANPILDTQLEIGKIRARIAIVQRPLSPDGISYSIRRHREDPWTYPLFVNNKMINPLSAGLMSFLTDGSRTMLIAGTRSSGKTSLLGSTMLEIIPKYRVIVIEDSLELPVESLRKLKYDILRMKVRSALLKTTNEVSADDGIRTSLRLGDSCLIIGEVRSVEAQALYEAMRVGALANVVAGTIHGASPYGVFDRVVNDLKVPATSFKATDIIAVANPIKTPEGLHSSKRLVGISEVRKHWTKDPLEEKGFVDLMKYNVETDELEPTEDFINGDSEIVKDIASGVKGWAGNWDAVWDNIMLRAKIKEELVNTSRKVNDLGLLESGFSTSANHSFHRISEKVRNEIGLPLGKDVFPEWQKWLNGKVKKRKF